MDSSVSFEARSRWVLVAGIFSASVVGLVYAGSIFILPVEELFGVGREQSSVMLTLGLFFMSFGMLMGGTFVERIGTVPAMRISAAVCCVGCLLAAQASNVWSFSFYYGVVVAFGLGICNAVPAAVCTRWFPHKTGLISGTLTMSLAVGTFFYGSYVADYLIKSLGLRLAFVPLAALLGGVLLFSSFLLKFPPSTFIVVIKGKKITHELWGATTGQMIRCKGYWLIWTWLSLESMAIMMLVAHLVPIMLDVLERTNGLNPAEATKTALLALGYFSFSNGLGRFAFGYIFDKMGRRFTLYAHSVFLLLATLAFPYLSSFGTLGTELCIIFLGLGYGGRICLSLTLLMEIFGPAHFSMNYGFTSTPLLFGALFGPALSAYLYAQSGTYENSILAAGIIIALAFVAVYLSANPRRTRWEH